MTKKTISILLCVALFISGIMVSAVRNTYAVVDFSSLTEGFEYNKAYTSTEMKAIYNNDIKSYDSGGIHKLVKDNNYGTSLQIFPKAKDTGGSVVMKLPEVITSGRLEIDMRFKILGTGNLVRHLFLPLDSNGNIIFTIDYDDSFGRNSSNKDTDSTKLLFNPSKHNGYYNFVCVITAPDSASDWTYEIYDKYNIEAGPFFTQELVRKVDNTKRQVLKEIGSMYLVGHWATTTAQADGTNGIEINKAIAYKSNTPKIVSVSEFDEISKSLTISFDKSVSTESAKVAVSPSGTATVSKGISNKEVVLNFENSFGEDRMYSVNLSGIGYEESEFKFSYDFDFFGYGTGSGLLKIVDYNTYTPKIYSKSELEGIDSAVSFSDAGTYEICDMHGGKNGLKISSNPKTCGGSLSVYLGEKITYGRIQIDADIKMQNGTGSNGLARNLFRPSGDGSPYTVCYKEPANGFTRSVYYNNASGVFNTNKPLHSDGFYRLSCVITAEDENSQWLYELYDRDGSLTKPFYTMTFPRTTNNVISDAKGILSYIDTINVTDIWFMDGNKTDDFIQISGVKIYKTNPGELVEVSEFDNKTNSFELTYNTPVKIGESTKITATDVDNNKIFAKVIQKTSKKIEVSFPWGVPYDGKICVTAENVNYYDSELGISSSFDIQGAVKDDKYLYNISVTDNNGNEVSNLDELSELNISFDSYGVVGKMLYMVTYKDGKMLNVNSKKITENDNKLKAPLNGADETKIFVWDESFKPIFNAFDIGCTEDGESGFLPISVQGGFYTEKDSVAECIKGHDTLYAKARIAAYKTYENLKASVYLTHNGEKQILADENAVFDNNISDVSIKLDVKELGQEDLLEFVISDNDNEYFSKKLLYDDPKYTIDILLVAGQSNALGQYADKTLSVKPEEGTVYFNKMGDTTLSTSGNEGWSGALGKSWHDRTGHTVLVVKAAWGGTGFEAKSTCYGLWSPDATTVDLAKCTPNANHCYNEAKVIYNTAVSSVQSYLDSGYEIGNCVYFWFQGENELVSYTAEQYKNAFMKMHNGFTTEFGDKDTRLEIGGILPVRNNSSYANISTSLKISGPRAAQSYLSNSREDIIMASTATENWYSDASIKAWFDAKYPNNSYTNGDMPDSIDDVWRNDYVHYNQKIHNEFGEEAANTMLDYLENSKNCEGISLIGENGIKHYKDGDTIILPETDVSPIIYPTSGAKTAKYTISGTTAEISEYNVITALRALENDYSVLTVTLNSGKTMSFKLYSSVRDDSITIAPVKDNKSAIYTLTTDDNLKYTNEYLDAKFEELGLVGTLGLVVDWIGKGGMLSLEDARALVDSGRWDVANHTMSHKQAEFESKTITDAELQVEINDARDVLLDYFPGEKLVSIYTPGGGWSDKIVDVVKENHLVLRRASGGNNPLPITPDQMLDLKTRAVFSNTTLQTMNSWIDTAISNGQWVCEMWHGIGNDASEWGGNTTTQITDAHLAYVKQKKDEGKLWVTTLDEAGIYSYQRAKTNIRKISESDSEIVVSITDDLDDKIFDSELTINVNLPEGWSSVLVIVGDQSLKNSIKDGVLSFNVPHDSERILISRVK